MAEHKKERKTKWEVTARAFDRWSGIPVGGGEERKEVVDTSNLLFKDCGFPLDVKTAYESFWNDLNPHSEQVVFVSQVIPLEKEGK